MPASFELKKAANGEHFFNLKASNGEVILTSETYKARAGALNGIEAVRKNAPVDHRYEKKASSSGKPFFVLKSGNHQVIGRSEMYESEKACASGIKAVMKAAPAAKLKDLTAV
jgi:uncharacterized protein YegP (UPF0339 family)